MSNPERHFEGFSKEVLEELLGYVPKSELEAAMLFMKVKASRKENPERFKEKEFRRVLEDRNKALRREHRLGMAQHKIEWYLDVVDLVARSLRLAPKGELYPTEIDKILRLDGFYKKEYVDPKIKKLYQKPKNWETVKGAHNDLHSRYIGPNDIRKLAEEDSRFVKMDLLNVISMMTTWGNIVPGKATLSIRLEESV